VTADHESHATEGKRSKDVSQDTKNKSRFHPPPFRIPPSSHDRSAQSSVIRLSCPADSDGGVTVAGSDTPSPLDRARRAGIDASRAKGIDSLLIPDSDDFERIPQDAANPLSHNRVLLGQLLFHDTAQAVPTSPTSVKSRSCATCHHSNAGFKAGIPQGIGEGGLGVGIDGSERVLAPGYSPQASPESGARPDIQPLGTPTVLNTAFQDVMLWNGQFGNAVGGVNATADGARLATPDTPNVENLRMLSGLETQAIAGMTVHRLDTEVDHVLNHNGEYRALFEAAFGSTSTDDYHRDAGLAIAAYERTILANQAPFQKWLRGDLAAMSDSQKRGAVLFFGKAACSDCHQGPALSSLPGATEDDMFFAVGMQDLNTDHAQIHGTVAISDKQGRGGFTGRTQDMYRFKIPQLYNLSDNVSLGHGASFTSIKDVIRYKNRAIAQNPASLDYLDHRFVPLSLSEVEMDDLADFITDGLYDPDLGRYAPSRVPSGACVIVDSPGSGC